MKFLENKTKSAVYTFLVYFLVIAEMGVLSGYRFIVPTDKYLTGLLGTAKGSSLQHIGATIGWNYIVASCIIILAVFAYAMLLGYNRNPGGMIAIILLDFLPFLGFAFDYNFFYGYGTAHILPAMTLFGIHTGSRASQVIFISLFAILTAAFWFLGRHVRSIYAAKYEIEI